MLENSASLLRLLHLADSALPVGATAHSFGLETLVQDGDVDLPHLGRWCNDYLIEAGTVDAYFCRRGWRLGASAGSMAPDELMAAWRAANQELSALRPARESRVASHTLGGRLLRLLADLEPQPLWPALLAVRDADTHYAPIFGLGGAVLCLPEEDVVLALLRQNVAGLVSACQRLMPLGQGRAGQLLWQLHGAIAACAAAAQTQPFSFAALLDAGSMRHPAREVRLFIS